MNTNFNKNIENIVNKLAEKQVKLKCPMCNGGSFKLAGGYFAHDLQDDLDSRSIGGKNIPTLPLVCKNCGFVAEFALGALGLLPVTEFPDEKRSVIPKLKESNK